MTRKEFIAELTTDLKQYDESGLIDYRSVKLWIKNSMKRFGNNIMIPSDIVLKVENGRAQVPENFWQLYLGVRCEPKGYSIVEGTQESLIMSTTYKIRTESDVEWNNQVEGYVGKDYKSIVERVVVTGGVVVDYYYHNPSILRITKGMKKESCYKTCKNLQDKFTHSAKWEINIVNETIQTNFKTGYIYIQYMAFPTDDNGEFIIPETQHGHLYNYLMYHCKARLFENLIGNGDETNIANMFQYYSAKEKEYLSLAMTETKFGGLTHDWDVKMKNKMRKDTLKYESMFPNI